MTSKDAQKELQNINKLPQKEKKFAKNTFFYEYLVLVAHKGNIYRPKISDNTEL